MVSPLPSRYMSDRFHSTLRSAVGHRFGSLIQTIMLSRGTTYVWISLGRMEGTGKSTIEGGPPGSCRENSHVVPAWIQKGVTPNDRPHCPRMTANRFGQLTVGSTKSTTEDPGHIKIHR